METGMNYLYNLYRHEKRPMLAMAEDIIGAMSLIIGIVVLSFMPLVF